MKGDEKEGGLVSSCGDKWSLAAHALALDATLVTASLDHMIRVPGLRVEDWSG